MCHAVILQDNPTLKKWLSWFMGEKMIDKTINEEARYSDIICA